MKTEQSRLTAHRAPIRCDECGVEYPSDCFLENMTVCNECAENMSKAAKLPTVDNSALPITELQNSDSTLQLKVNHLLKWGLVFSIFWLAGIGSLVAIVLARKAHQLISQSDGKVIGKGRVWWCYIVGGLGIIFWFPIIIAGIVNHI